MTQFKKWAKEPMRHLIKNWYTDAKQVCENVSYYGSAGNCELKEQWDAITHLFEWLKPKTPQMLVRMWNNRNSHCWWEYKLAQTFWKVIWQFLIKLNIFLPYDSVIVLLGIYPRSWKLCTQIHLHKDDYST